MSITGTRGIRQPAHETDMMSLTIRALFWFLIVSAATSLVFEAWRGRSATQSPPSYGSDDPGDPSPLETYRGSHIGVGYRALDSIRTPWGSDDGPEISAVILNWSRFQNVVLIVSGFCDPSLQDVITEIVVWNNSPRRISAEVSRGTVNVRASHRFRNILYLPHSSELTLHGRQEFDASCRSRLRIINSPENLYFQARFMACSNSSSKYCFIQVCRPPFIPSIDSGRSQECLRAYNQL